MKTPRFAPILLKGPFLWPMDGRQRKEPCGFVIEPAENGWRIEALGHQDVQVNGLRIERQLLEESARIEVDGRMMYWLEPYLLVNEKTDQPFGYLPLVQPLSCGGFRMALRPQAQVISLEPLPPFAAVNTAAGSSPALMMLFSTLGAAAGSLITQNSWQTLLASAISSMSMAGGFFLWGFWNRRKEKQSGQKQNAQQLERYQVYAADRNQELEERLQHWRHQMREQKEALLSLSAQCFGVLDEASPLPAAIGQEEFFRYSIQGGSSLSLSPQAQTLAKTLENTRLSGPVWQCLHPGRVYDICAWTEHQIEWLGLLIDWMDPKHLWHMVWIGCDAPDILPACAWEMFTPLVFPDEQSFAAFAASWPGRRWIVICGKIPYPLSDSMICLLKTPHPSAETCSGSLFPDQSIPVSLRRKAGMGRLENQASLSLTTWLEEQKNQAASARMMVQLAPSVYWDLCRDGPHALVAGATGSGKSEALSLVLMQLAWLNTPEQVQMVLIDFKGGSFSASLALLPHVAGLITNLESGGLRRLEKALHLELTLRQDAVARYVSKHPECTAQSQEVVDERTGQPFSEIVIVVDEFGQLRQQAPESMRALQEIARIGRSLGIHLILATQKPAGLVDEQIWANAKTKLCFSVQSPADSREVLGHDKAAALVQPGQFILQTGVQQEQSGKAWYLKAGASGARIYEQSACGWKEAAQKSLQEELLAAIQKRQQQRKWLLCPDPAAEARESDQLLLDELTHATPLVLKPSESQAWCGSQRQLLQAANHLAAQSKRPVLAMKGILCSQRIACSELYEVLEEQVPPCLLILWTDPSPPPALIERLLKQNRHQVILLCKQPDYRMERWLSLCDARLAFFLDNREAEAIFFPQGRNKPVLPQAFSGWRFGHQVQGACGANPSDFTPARQQIVRPIWLQCSTEQAQQECGPILAGVEPQSLRPVCLNEPLDVLYASRRGKELALSFLQRLCLRDPLLSVSETMEEKAAVHLLNAAAIKDWSEWGQKDFLFAGEGLGTCAYALSLRVPMDLQGNAALVFGSEVSDLNLAGWKEE